MTEHEIRKIEVEAYLYSAKEPSQEQLDRLRAFLEKKYQKTVGVVWRKDESVHDGFRIEVGTSVYRWQLDQIYDWSAAGQKPPVEGAGGAGCPQPWRCDAIGAADHPGL